MEGERLLDQRQIAKRTGYTVATIRQYATTKDFPPPRLFGPHGRTLYATDDVDWWLELHLARLERKPRKRQ